jgi:hypothetical protein
MKVLAHLRDTHTGRTCVYEDPWRDTFPDGTPVEAHNVIFQWLEGNWSCDCNRLSFLEHTLNPAAWPILRKILYGDQGCPCGHDRVELDKLIVNGEEVDTS